MNQKVCPKKRLVKLLAIIYLWDSKAVPFSLECINAVSKDTLLDTAYDRSEHTTVQYRLKSHEFLGVRSDTRVCDRRFGCAVGRRHAVYFITAFPHWSRAAHSGESWAESRKNKVKWSVTAAVFTTLDIKWSLNLPVLHLRLFSRVLIPITAVDHTRVHFLFHSLSAVMAGPRRFQRSWHLGDIKQWCAHFLLYCVYIF